MNLQELKTKHSAGTIVIKEISGGYVTFYIKGYMLKFKVKVDFRSIINNGDKLWIILDRAESIKYIGKQKYGYHVYEMEMKDDSININKTETISAIKKIIEEWGETNTMKLELGSSPIHKTLGNSICALIENFNKTDVNVMMYHHDNEIGNYSVSYEELEEDTLDEILLILQDYDVDMTKTMDRCKDENY